MNEDQAMSGLREFSDRLLQVAGKFEVQERDGHPFAIVPADMKPLDLEGYFPPRRIKQRVLLSEVGSFVDYVERFKTPDTMVFANIGEDGATFTAVLDYHGRAPGLAPAYGCHVATFILKQTPEWVVWKAANRKVMGQVDFATWLEDNATLFVNPTGADLLELVRSLHGHKNARFSTALRLDNGAYSVGYDEDVEIKGTSTARSGSMELPPVIEAGFAPFLGAHSYLVRARLKSRVNDRALSLWFETIEMHQIVRDSILLVVAEIEEKTGLRPLLGHAG